MQDLSVANIDDFPLTRLDGRTKEARRFKGIMRALVAEYGKEPTAAELALITSAAMFQMLIERDSLQILQGNTDDLPDERMRRNMVAMKSCLTSLGLVKQARDIRIGDLKKGTSVLSQTAPAQ